MYIVKRHLSKILLLLLGGGITLGLAIVLRDHSIPLQWVDAPTVNNEKKDAVSGATRKISLKEAMYYEKKEEEKVQCQLCFRKCTIGEGQRGFCRNRENKGGTLYSLVYAKPCAVQVDPIEKEPQLHMLPGTDILCLATVSCNFRCKQCQNWQISQSAPEDVHSFNLPPEEVVEIAIQKKIPTISFTYTEPTVFYEYMYDIAVIAKMKGVKILIHTNGSLAEAPLKELLKYTDAVTVDLKGFSEDVYRQAYSSELAPVLNTLKIIKEHKVWLEIVNLVIPGVNDDMEDIRKMCRFIKEHLGSDVPIHFTRFHPAFKLQHLAPTPVQTLEKAWEIAKSEGLLYATIGNVPGHKNNSTFCPKCQKVLLKRIHFEVVENNVKDGACKFCGNNIPGIWK